MVFDSLPNNQKYGVYVDYFDSVADVTENTILPKITRGYNCYFIELRSNMERCKTRAEARTKAIEKAVEIYNNK